MDKIKEGELMARIRTIKPEFWTDEKIVELSPYARLLFIGIWNFCDDDGRMVYSPKRLKMQIFPSDNVDCSELVGEIRGESLIKVYAVDNVEYLQVCGFEKHQKIDKRTASKLPSPPNSPESPRITPTEGKGMEGIKEGNKSACEEKTSLPKKETVSKSVVALPEWLPLDAWNGYAEMRRKIKKPMTDYAAGLRIKDLEGFMSEGQDPEAVLNQSIVNSWTDLYPLKGKTAKGSKSDPPKGYV
jgi:hypothetical protein